MSIATQIARLQSIKNAIKESLISRGVEATDHNMENFAEDILNVKNKNVSTWYMESFGQEDMGEDNRIRYVDAALLKPDGVFEANQRNVIDMGRAKAYQYVDTMNVPNKNSNTYTFPANSNGATYNMGEHNDIQYVNATNVYNYGYSAGRTMASGKFTSSSSTGGSSTINLGWQPSNIAVAYADGSKGFVIRVSSLFDKFEFVSLLIQSFHLNLL